MKYTRVRHFHQPRSALNWPRSLICRPGVFKYGRTMSYLLLDALTNGNRFQNKRQSMRQTSRQASSSATNTSRHQSFTMASQGNDPNASYGGSTSPTNVSAQQYLPRSDSRPPGAQDSVIPRREDDPRKWPTGRY